MVLTSKQARNLNARSRAGLVSPRERLTFVVAAACAVVLGACGGTSEVATESTPDTTMKRPLVVVTHEVLGSIVREIAVDDVDVRVIIPNGKDPHDYEPSAQDIALLDAADMVVANGEKFEPAFTKVLDRLVADGQSVFFATEHVTLRDGDEYGEHSDDEAHDEHGEHSDDEAHDGDKDVHGEHDPHFFTDPVTVGELIPALAEALTASTGVSHGARPAIAADAFAAADTAVREVFATLSSGSCKIVTGHDSLGYLADRYGCEIVGVVIPSPSGLAEATAQDFADLAKAMKTEKVSAIFVDEGTSTRVSDRIAAETGARVVALPSHSVPPSGRYRDYVTTVARAITGGLTGS